MHDLKTSTLIRNGLQYLWDGRSYEAIRSGRKEEYLCHAIARSVRRGVEDWYGRRCPEREVEIALNRVRNMICERLRPHFSLSNWLASEGISDKALAKEQDVQTHRRQWALKMIAEFEAKGD